RVVAGCLWAHVRRRPGGRVARLRGLRPSPGRGGQPGQRGRAAGDIGRRRAPDRAPPRVSALGQPRVHYRVIGSTNARARELAAAGVPHGTVVTAAEQSAGRGRQGRTWSAAAGRALLCSVVVRDPPTLLPLATGVAVAEVVGTGALLKWPNDVLADGRKVAGIL